MNAKERAAHKAAIQADLDKISEKQIVSDTKGNPRDNTARFKLVGGPYHDKVVRLLAPFDDLVFPDGSKYCLHPPLSRRSDRWVYVHEASKAEASDSGADTEGS